MNIRKVLSTVLVIIWMLTIFYFSHQRGDISSNVSKRASIIIVNILDINKQMDETKKEEMVVMIEPIIRKLAHYTLYMLGGILIINCVNTYINEDVKIVRYSSFIGVMYAISDELHQIFINDRSGNIVDIIIDSIGIFTGITVYLAVNKTIETIIVDRKKINGGE